VILLARHGQTSENAAGRILGRRDPPLSDAGRAEAAALAESVAGEGLRVVWTSPLLRARETAAIVAAHLGLAPVVLDELIESRRGSWEGMSYAELAQGSPGLLAMFEAGDLTFRFPGGEAIEDQIARTQVALERIAAGPLPAVAVTHAGTIRAALAIHGRPVPPERALPHGRALSFDAVDAFGEPR
jgi:broad specificity phosphatase PhoE